MGTNALYSNTTAHYNTAMGYGALQDANRTADANGYNIALGYNAGNTGTNDVTTGNLNTLLGASTAASAAAGTNQTVIGYGASGKGDNTVTIGNGDITLWSAADDGEVDLGSSSVEFKDLYVDGVAYTDALGFGTVAMTLPTADGSANQVLKTDGGGALSWATQSASSIAADDITAGDAAVNITTVDESDLTLGNAASDAYFKVAASATPGNEDIRIVNTNGTDEAAIAITATAGGVDINAATGKDVDVAGGTVNLTSSDDAAAAIYLRANAGTSETVKIHSDQGTSVTEGAESVTILSDVGGVGIRSTANLAKAVNITSDGGTTGSIAIFNDQGTSVAEGSESISILSDAGGVGLRSTANLANAINLTVDGGTTSTMTLFNDQGTSVTESAASVQLLSDAGGIGIKSTANLANAILLTADGGTSETIKVHADQGTSATSIELVSDAGGVTISAASSGQTDGSGGVVDFNGSEIDNYKASTASITSATTLASTHNGKVLICNSSSDFNLTVPEDTLPVGFNCMIVQIGAGEITLAAASGNVTINNRNSHTKTANTWAIMSLICIDATTDANVFVSGGDGAS
jgi:hypothetical protein